MPEQTVRPPITLNIRYTDAFNHDTERLVTIDRVDIIRTRPRAVMGYCHAREDTRTFIIDRIETAFSDDGEIIPIEDLTAALMDPTAPRSDAMQRSDPNAPRRASAPRPRKRMRWDVKLAIASGLFFALVVVFLSIAKA